MMTTATQIIGITKEVICMIECIRTTAKNKESDKPKKEDKKKEKQK